ncbi:MAG: 50S ribosomal protein L6 [Candidatus Omnitrophica bacterium]|nr:50S ribosomal protein L6 [Candidatus Omnitrophota bacterium]MBU1853548.1 50S ribosomal protein L6 [Candidatus Omnitrophota bacterium]
MSRVGKKPIQVPDKVKVMIESGKISVEGPKGKLVWDFPKEIEVKIDGSQVIVNRRKEDKISYSMHGTVRTCISNMIKGVTEGYTKALEIHGVGYRAQVQGKAINLQLGYSHPIGHPIPEGISVKTPKPNQIVIEGIDKVKVGELAAEIRSYLVPEPYKGKGIRYKGEYVRKKAGKAVA